MVCTCDTQPGPPLPESKGELKLLKLSKGSKGTAGTRGWSLSPQLSVTLEVEYDPKNEELHAVVARFLADSIIVDNHRFLPPKRKRKPSKTPFSAARRNENGVVEPVFSIYYRYLHGTFDKEIYGLRRCPVVPCFTHTIRLSMNVPYGPLPLLEFTQDDVNLFKQKAFDFADLEESKATPNGCLLIDKKYYAPEDTMFQNPPHVWMWNRSNSICRTLLALDTKINPAEGETLRHDPILCNNTRCMQRTHFKGFGSIEEQVKDKKIAYPNTARGKKRKQAEELLLEGQMSRREIREETGLSRSSIQLFSNGLKGLQPKERKDLIPENTEEYRKEVKAKWMNRVVIKGTCLTVPSEFLDYKGRPRYEKYLGKSRRPYTILYAIEKNNGVLPPRFIDGVEVVMEHNEIEGDENYCWNRPNCLNSNHVKPGTPASNAKTRKRRKGEENPSHIFTDAETEKISDLVGEGHTAEQIHLKSDFQHFTYRQIWRKVKYFQNKLQDEPSDEEE